MSKPLRKKMTVREEANAPLGGNKLTPEIEKRVAQYARKGITLNVITACVGLSDYTMKRWMEKGRNYVELQGGQDKHRKYGRFYMEWRKAYHMKLKELQLQLYDYKFRKDWRRIRTILSCVDPGNWTFDKGMLLGDKDIANPKDNFL